jgi:hypothetical protein
VERFKELLDYTKETSTSYIADTNQTFSEDYSTLSNNIIGKEHTISNISSTTTMLVVEQKAFELIPIENLLCKF